MFWPCSNPRQGSHCGKESDTNAPRSIGPAGFHSTSRQRHVRVCQMSREFYRSTFQADHITAEVHGGQTSAENLCWTCFHCNLHKGTNLGGIDPKPGKKAWLFHPRRMKWARHFR